MKKRRANVIKKKPIRVHPIPDSCMSKTTTANTSIIEGKSQADAMDVDSDVAEAEADDRLNVLQCRNFIYESLLRNDKLNLLKGHLSDILRLSGWNRVMNENFMEYINNEDDINMSHMLCDMIPFGRDQVPPSIRESMRDILRSIALTYLSIDDSKPTLQENEEPSDTYLPYEYQTRDTVPDYGDQSVFAQQFESSVTSPTDDLPLPEAGIPSSLCVDIASASTTNSPSSLTRDLGVIVLLDRFDREKDNETEKLEREKVEQKEAKDKERQEKDRLRQELEKERLECQERERQEQRDRERHEQKERERQEQKDRERQEQKERERQEQKERERQEQKERERQELKERDRYEHKERRERHSQQHQSLSVPSSPSTPRPEKKTNLTESAMMLKLAQMKQPPSLASTLITATAAIAGKKSKHINLNSDNDDDDEDDEELMDI